ncbi:hypothetical protein E6O75_ATG04847 [Venturia nashicola]|uniref:Uncharacterized protein n=1 Tax=Venturia nashicola TaxID=86259 RepID=A0A4Z1NZ96_9PEZI|nr:hypothetical protein E6O75_ATG04847 [Venturia nashicola]
MIGVMTSLILLLYKLCPAPEIATAIPIWSQEKRKEVRSLSAHIVWSYHVAHGDRDYGNMGLPVYDTTTQTGLRFFSNRLLESHVDHTLQREERHARCLLNSLPPST